MKIEVESSELIRIAAAIEHDCFMLGYTDPEDAEDDIDFYIPSIKSMAGCLRLMVWKGEKQKQTGGANQ